MHGEPPRGKALEKEENGKGEATWVGRDLRQGRREQEEEKQNDARERGGS